MARRIILLFLVISAAIGAAGPAAYAADEPEAPPPVQAALDVSDSPGSAAAPSPLASPSPDLTIELDAPFELELGRSAVIEDVLLLRFDSVIADSRCPADVQCVWEGNAEVAIQLQGVGAAGSTLRLNSNPTFAMSADYLAFTVSLIGLEPYPRTDRAGPEPYQAALLVVEREAP